MDRNNHEDHDSSSETKEETKSRRDQGSSSRKQDHEEADSNEEKKSESGKSEGDEEENKKSKAPSKRVLIIGGIVVGVLLIIGLLYYLHARHFISTDDAYTTGHVHQISSRVMGTVEEVRVDDNQPVKMGQVLVALDPRIYNLSLEKARAQLGQARASVEQAQAEVVQKMAANEQADADLQKTQTDYDRAGGLYQKDIKAVSKAQVDAADAALKSAKGAYAAAKANTLAAEAQITVAKAGVANAQAAVHDAELQLSYTKVLAPIDGVISKKTVETGQRIQPGQALMAVVENDVWVLANLKETQLAQVQVGQHVAIHVDAIPDKDFAGHIDSFQQGTGSEFALLPPDNATGNFTKIVQRVPVKIVFEPQSVGAYRTRIVPGLSVVPKIDLRTK